MSEPQLHKIRVNGVELAYFERGAPRSDRPTLLFVHCTGYHARVWDRIIESFAGYHVLALEQRGHGRSEKRRIEHWRVFGEDMSAFVRTLELARIIGIGHSMGGHSMVDAAAKSGAFEGLVVIDPVIGAPDSYLDPQPVAAFEGGVHPAAKRKNSFSSPQDMAERLLQKGAYGHFERRMLDDYCKHGLVQTEAGDYQLACPPEVEASVYMAARSNGAIYDSVRSLDIPVLVLRAQLPPADRTAMDFAWSPTWPELVNEFKHGREIHYADCTHFIPMQIPDEVVRVLQQEVKGWQQSAAEDS
jgi:pimeloyl-ACP methyl ester carboxylesterase